jgi:hypothetical protein
LHTASHEEEIKEQLFTTCEVEEERYRQVPWEEQVGETHTLLLSEHNELALQYCQPAQEEEEVHLE